MKINFLILLTFVLSANKVNGFCFYDGSTYNFEGEFLFTHESYWFCWSSYVEKPLYTNTVILTFTNIEIDCRNSYLEIDDQNNNILNYCKTYPSHSHFVYVTKNASRIIIQKKGTIEASLYVQFRNLPNQPNTTLPIETSTQTIQTISFTIPNPTFTIETSKPAYSSCGIPGIKPDETGLVKIVGGIPVIPRSWPWQAFLTDYRFACGGSLINEQWIITAAHCQFFLNTMFADLGEFNIRNLTDNLIRVKVDKFIKHPQYGDPFNTYEFDYDIALVKLRTPIAFTDSISPICMPNGHTPELGEVGITTGWGRTNSTNEVISDILRQTSITVMPKEICSRFLRTNRQICAGEIDPVHSSCKGDSGGPFALKDNSDAYYLSGVVSSGYDQCGGRTIYTNVAEFESWISEVLANN